MIVKLPIVHKTYEDGKIKKERGKLEVEINSSVFAHLKWEEHFQDTMAGKPSLTDYAARLEKRMKDQTESVNFVSALKVLYCFIDSPKLPTFRDFVKMLDDEVVDETLETLKNVLNEVGETSSKN